MNLIKRHLYKKKKNDLERKLLNLNPYLIFL